MRSDMQKLICERPRRGSRTSPSIKTGLKLNPNINYDDDIDTGPSRISSSGPKQFGWNSKDLNENLNPLERFLVTSIGRRWDDVYSEIRANIDLRKAIGLHVMQHLKYMIEIHAIMIDSRPFSGRWGTSEHDGLYVDPATGIVCNNNKYGWWRKTAPEPVDSILWYRNTYFKRETILKTPCCGLGMCHYPPKESGVKTRRTIFDRRYTTTEYDHCIHGIKADRKSLWYVVEYRFHDAGDVYRVDRPQIYETDPATNIRRIVTGPPKVIYYRDVPKKLAEPYIFRRKVANKKELKLIRTFEGANRHP